jgi:glycosyltransferase involved in cell wall biosynthesis
MARPTGFLGSLAERIFTRLTRKDPLWLTIWLDGIKAYFWLRRWRRRGRRLAVHQCANRDGPPRIAFVMTWFGRDAAGGAESEARGLIQALRIHAPEIEVEVFATTLKEFAADWDTAFHPAGTQLEDGVPIHRFAAEAINRDVFHFLNGTYLMKGGTEACWNNHQQRRSPVDPLAEAYFLRHMIYSPALLEQLIKQRDEYDAFVLIPYLFTTTVLASHLIGDRCLLLPCLHDERYAFMDIYEDAFNAVHSALCHVRSEVDLYRRLYPHAAPPTLLGEQVDVDVPQGNAEQFRTKYGITAPFLLYAGRQVEGKNLPLLIDWFTTHRQSSPEHADLQLVLLGKGDLDFSKTPGVHALGYIPAEDKLGAYRAALSLVMLSVFESFSIVLMEAWLQETPVIVHADCAVTRDHVNDSSGGLAVRDVEEFTAAINRLRADEKLRMQMGQKGRAYVLEHYRPEMIVQRFKKALEAVQQTPRRA